MKVFIAALATETNTFSPIPTGESGFRETGLFHGDATKHPPSIFSEPLCAWRELAERDGHTVVESLYATAQPAGRTVARVYEGFRDEILADLWAAMPVGMVLLMLHGAMVAEGEDDCEGDLIALVRQVVGPDTPIGVELDLHCHITEKMTRHATAIITFKEYPHIDGADRARETYVLCRDAAEGKTKPCISVHDCRMISMWRTPDEPVRSFVERLKSLEGHDGVLSVSFGHGFPWGDVKDAGARMLVVTDDRPEKGSALAAALAKELWEMRAQTDGGYVDGGVAVAQALAAASGPVVLADFTDNPGGGAPGDSTFLLRRILDSPIESATLGFLWDPIAVRFCQDGGEGAILNLRVGGKCGAFSGDPVDIRATVRKIIPSATQPFGSGTERMGDSVWISAGPMNLVLCSTRTQVFHPDGFAQFGIDLAMQQVVVVKSSQHFYAGFAPLAKKIIYVATPGAINPDFASIKYTKREIPFWPNVADPFEAVDGISSF